MGALEQLSTYLSYPFVVNALLVGVLVALCSSLLGTTLVMKRFSYIGDGLSHAAFGAYAVAAVTGVTQNMLIIAPATIVAAVLLLRRSQSARVRGDAALAMLSAASLAGGYMLMNVFGTQSNLSGDICSTLFGSTSILTLTGMDVVGCAVLSLLVVGGFVVLYNRIFCVTYDEGFARASGLPVDRCNLALAVMTALVVVVGMNLVGALLLSALVVFPAQSAMRVCHTFKSVTVCAAIMGTVGALAGMIVSILASTPVGSTIVLLDALCFVVASLVGWLQEKKGV